MTQTLDLFAHKVLRDHDGLRELVLKLEKRWLKPGARAFTRLGCQVEVDTERGELHIQRPCPERRNAA